MILGWSCCGFSKTASPAGTLVSLKSVPGFGLGGATKKTPPPRASILKNSNATVFPETMVRETPSMMPPAASIQCSSILALPDSPLQSPSMKRKPSRSFDMAAKAPATTAWKSFMAFSPYDALSHPDFRLRHSVRQVGVRHVGGVERIAQLPFWVHEDDPALTSGSGFERCDRLLRRLRGSYAGGHSLDRTIGHHDAENGFTMARGRGSALAVVRVETGADDGRIPDAPGKLQERPSGRARDRQLSAAIAGYGADGFGGRALG